MFLGRSADLDHLVFSANLGLKMKDCCFDCNRSNHDPDTQAGTSGQPSGSSSFAEGGVVLSKDMLKGRLGHV